MVVKIRPAVRRTGRNVHVIARKELECLFTQNERYHPLYHDERFMRAGVPMYRKSGALCAGEDRSRHRDPEVFVTSDDGGEVASKDVAQALARIQFVWRLISGQLIMVHCLPSECTSVRF